MALLKAPPIMEGKKTYILIAIFILGVVAEKAFGWDVPGFEPGPDWLQQILGAIGLGTLRASVGKLA